MYIADYHIHSTCSPDGKMTMSQAAEAALRAGLDEICITDHVDTIFWGNNAPRDSFDWESLRAQYREALEKYGDKLSIKLGAELGEAYLGYDRAEILLNDAEKLDFCIGSVHTCSEKYDCLDLYFLEEGQSPDYYRAVIEDYLDCVLAISRWGRFNVLGAAGADAGRNGFQILGRVAHGYAGAYDLEHFQVVIAVAKGYGLVRGQAIMVQNGPDTHTLAGGCGDHINGPVPPGGDLRPGDAPHQ